MKTRPRKRRESAAARAERARVIFQRLHQMYPDAHCALDHENAYQLLVATILSAVGFIPVTLAYDDDRFSFWQLYIPALIGLAITFLLVAITEYYTGSRWGPV